MRYATKLRWESYTEHLSWFGIVHTALARLNGDAKLEELLEFIARHPKTEQEGWMWRRMVLKQLASEPEFVPVKGASRWRFSQNYSWEMVQAQLEYLFDATGELEAPRGRRKK